jgi:hypothetical protein
MSIEERFLSDFSGGEISAKSSLEPKENQWLALKGFVLESNRRLRSQWAGATWTIERETSEDSSS